MFEAVQPDFQAVACTDAIKGLLSLPPTVLNHVSKKISDFNRLRDDEIDEIETRRLISELAFVYFLMPIAIRRGHVIFRGRSFESRSLLSTVQEFYAPSADLAVVQRANGHGETVFYGGSSDETVFSEVGATAGKFINIAALGVRQDCEITAFTIGEMDHYRRWRRNRFLPSGLELSTQETLSKLHPDVSLAIQLVDAFLADRFSRPGKEAYRVTNLIASEFLRSQSIDAIIYPSVALPGGTNYAIKDEVSRARLEVKACAAVEILNDYGYGSYRGRRYGVAKISAEIDSIPWVSMDAPQHVVQKFASDLSSDPDPVLAWLKPRGADS